MKQHKVLLRILFYMLDAYLDRKKYNLKLLVLPDINTCTGTRYRTVSTLVPYRTFVPVPGTAAEIFDLTLSDGD